MRGLGLGNPAFVFISTWLDFTWDCHSTGQMNKFPLRLWGFPNRLLKPSQWINCCLCFNVLRSFPLTSLLLHPYYLHLQSPPSSKIRIYPLFCLRLTYHVPCAIWANEMYVRQVLFCTPRQILLGWLNRGTVGSVARMGELRTAQILTLRSLTLYIYGAPILDVSRSHTTTQHSR